MSRYFKYKTADALLADAKAMGLDIRLSDDLSFLAAPITVSGRTVGNRLAIHPMEGCDGEPDGSPGELTLRRYRRFGDGGAKLIWGEAAAVVPEGRANTRQLVCDARRADGLARLLDQCRRSHREAWGDDSDLLVGLQLTHSGRYSVPRPWLAQHDPALDPRTVIDRETGRTADADTPLLSDDDLDRLQDRYVEAAEVAFRVGFDFIDLKQCHRYLLCELLSAHSRPGKYGGSFENRTRFIREVVGKIRNRLPDLMVATRMNVYDGIPWKMGDDHLGVPETVSYPLRSSWGTDPNDHTRPDLTEPIQLIGLLRELGVAMINVSMGNPYGSPHIIRPFEYPPPDGYETPEHPLIGVDRHFRATEEIQRAFPDLPIVGSGYSWLQAFIFHAAAANVRDGRVAIVGVGRASLSHPDFARNVLEGRPLDRRRICRTFSYCTALMRSKHNDLGQFPTGCPPFDKVVYDPIWKLAQETAPPRG
ncbi:oxidoreductase [Tautonia sociabilis]|uniref:NADH:flavin oxidoreductase n=1 Tax=Tautonia sociabilis TaxID=2080755 RepID=A0A432MP51_9BACT|nr:NADH:flavin oxidoreductase [Tautonia sociabilis]RUL88886.1 NADH:flavin oxidoreductase [Tautonia sociabilis]